MNTGMLWFDNDPKTDLAAKVLRAANYYENKYGRKPDLCFLHPSMLNGNHKNAHGIALLSTRSVLPNHLWIGSSEIVQAEDQETAKISE